MCARMVVMIACAFVMVAAFAWTVPPAALARTVHVFSTTFGSEGSGSGQFVEPVGVAVNSTTHDVYVVDRTNGRVEKFSANGATVLGEFDGSTAPGGPFSAPDAIAVDNVETGGLDPSAGDVYVVDAGHDVIDKFNASGTFEAQLTGPESGAFGPIEGLAVDGAGNLWVYRLNEESGEGELDEFSDTGTFVKRVGTGRGALPGLAISADGRIAYVVVGDEKAIKLDTTTGRELAEWRMEFNGSESVGALAVDFGSGHIFVDGTVEGEGVIQDFAPFDENEETPPPEPFSTPLQTITAAGFADSPGIAVDASSGTIYASERSADQVAVFERAVVPDVTTGSAAAQEGEATLRGTVDPDGLPLTSCQFEYGTTAEYGTTVPCSTSPGEIGSGEAPVSVQATVTGLEPRTVYHFRLVAANANGSTQGQDATFTTVTGPLIEDELARDVTATNATLGAQLNPGGLPTSYSFEYGTSAEYGASVPVSPASIGAGLVGVSVAVPLTGLSPGTAYHFRVVAHNALGTAAGADSVLVTQASGGQPFSLPDGRAFEMVSPPDKSEGEVAGVSQVSAWQSSLDGDAVAYGSEQPFGDSETGAAQGHYYLASRGVGGWSTHALLPPQAPGCNLCRPLIEMYSADLSHDILLDGGGERVNGQDDPVLVAGEPAGVPNLFLRETHRGGSTQLINLTPPEVAPSAANLQGASADLSHIVFGDEAQLTPNAPGGNNLYEWVAGSVRLVSILEGGVPEGGAVLGDGNNHMVHAVSDDGSHVFFSAAGRLFVRIDGASTRQLDAAQGSGAGGGGRFMTATGDGRVAFFTDDSSAGLTTDTAPGSGTNLYEFDTRSSNLLDLTPAPLAEVQGVLAASEDGALVYFVATGDLTPGRANARGETAQEGEENLYAYDSRSATPLRFVAKLSPEDALDWEGAASERIGTTVRLTPDGDHLAFESVRGLTGYDNRVRDGGSCGRSQGGATLGEHCTEIFEYDASSDSLTCPSCDPTGARPLGPSLIGAPFQSQDEVKNYATRNFSEDGDRLFFDSVDSLVPNDQNGVMDVYEHESAGTGSCKRAEGCLYLISTGTSPDASYFEDASPNGDDVFFTTEQRLVGQDIDGRYDLYDARVGGGFAAPGGTATCEEEACRPPISPVLTGAPAPSMGAVGAGNLGPAPTIAIAKIAIAGKKLSGTTITLRVRVSGAGLLSASGSGLRTARKKATAAGTVELVVHLGPKAARRLRRAHTLGVTVKVGFRSTAGATSHLSVAFHVRRRARG